jgi:hypothetical protein
MFANDAEQPAGNPEETMKKPASIICCILIFALTLPISLLGRTAAGNDSDWNTLATVRPGTKVIVRVKDGEIFSGKLKGFSENSISLIRDGKIIDLERAKIATVSRTGRSFKKPVLIGTAIGAGAGTALGIAAGGCSPHDFICFDRKVTIPAGAVVFGILGALGGLVVGLGHHHEIVIYRSSPP